MRILMVIGQFYPTIGGAERQCLKLSKELIACGHTVTVLTVRQSREFSWKDEIDGIKVLRVGYPYFSLGRKRFGFGFLAPCIMLGRLFREVKKYDVLHVHQALWPAYCAAVAARWAKKPIVCKIGNSGIRFDFTELRRGHLYGSFAVRYIKKYIDVFVWTSRAVYEDLKNAGLPETKLRYIPNGVLLGNEGQRASNAKTRFIFTGTLTPKKNLGALIEAVRRLPISYQERLTLRIFGEGPQRGVLTERVKADTMDRVIELHEAVPNIEEYLKTSDVFILPSVTEGLSNSALEAMAHGLPLVISRAGGNPDLIDGNGIFIDPKDIPSIVDAIMYMFDHPHEREEMGKRSREIVKKRFSIAKVANQYEKLFEHCLSTYVS